MYNFYIKNAYYGDLISQGELEEGQLYIVINADDTDNEDFTNVFGFKDLIKNGVYIASSSVAPTNWGAVELKKYSTKLKIYPFYESNGIKRSLYEEQKFSRDDFDGDIILKDNDYDYMKSLVDIDPTSYVEFLVYLNDTEIFKGNILVNGSYNTIEKLCNLNVEAADQYAKIINNQDTEYDIINSDIDIYTCNVQAQEGKLEFSPTLTDGFTAYISISEGYQVYASEVVYVPKALVSDLVANSGFYQLSETNGVYKLGRDWSYSGEFTSPLRGWFWYTTTDPLQEINEVSCQDVYYSNESTTQYFKVVYTGLVAYDEDREVDVYYFMQYQFYPVAPSIAYTRTRRLDDTIEWLIGQMDSSILFDEQSFLYFDTNEDLQNILIAGITDIILNPSGTAQQDEGSTKGLLTFKSLTDLFEQHPFHLYWFLQKKIRGYYFRLKHITEIVSGASQINLTSLNGENWCEDKGSFGYKESEFFGKYILKNTSGNIAFDDQTITTGLVNIKENFEKNIAKFYFDVWDIQNNPSKYPNLSVDQFVLMASNLGVGNNLTDYFFNGTVDGAYRPFDDFNFNGDTMSLYLETLATQTYYTIAYSSTFSISTGVTYIIEFDSLDLSFESDDFTMFLGSTSPSYTPMSNLNILKDGVLSYEFTATHNFNASLVFSNRQLSYAKTLTATNIRIYIKDVFQCNKSVSVRTEQEVINADLSFANVLENHGKYEFCSSPVIMNGESTVVETLKVKEQETINIPIYNPNDIDFTKLVTTNMGDVEAENLTIKFNEQYAQFKGKF